MIFRRFFLIKITEKRMVPKIWAVYRSPNRYCKQYHTWSNYTVPACCDDSSNADFRLIHCRFAAFSGKIMDKGVIQFGLFLCFLGRKLKNRDKLVKSKLHSWNKYWQIFILIMILQCRYKYVRINKIINDFKK